MILSDRLKAVTDLLPEGNTVADIGCDHGYISISLVKSGKYNKAIAMDVRKGPLAAAKENIAREDLGEKIETRISDGFDKLVDKEVDGAIVAGMGGALVNRLISNNLLRVKQIKYIVLQPQSEIHLVRQFLRANNFAIISENMVKDDGKYYPMFLVSAVLSKENEASDALVAESELQKAFDYYGEILLKEKNEVLHEYLNREKTITENILTKLPEDNIDRVNELKDKLNIIDIALSYYK